MYRALLPQYAASDQLVIWAGRLLDEDAQTVIRYALPAPGAVELSIYNMAGQRVRTLARQSQASGEHAVTWDGRTGDGRAVGTGVYLYRLHGPEIDQTRRMLIVK